MQDRSSTLIPGRMTAFVCSSGRALPPNNCALLLHFNTALNRRCAICKLREGAQGRSGAHSGRPQTLAQAGPIYMLQTVYASHANHFRLTTPSLRHMFLDTSINDDRTCSVSYHTLRRQYVSARLDLGCYRLLSLTHQRDDVSTSQAPAGAMALPGTFLQKSCLLIGVHLDVQEICLQTVAANFAVSPSLAYLPEAHLSKLISLLSLELPLELAGTVSNTQCYWLNCDV